MIDIPGRGVWDSLGSGIAKPEVQTITHRGKAIAASSSLLQTSLNAWRALNGQRNLLWKSSDGGTTNQWRYARVMDVRTDWGLRNGTPYAIVEMDFELAASPWNGAAHTAESTTLDATPHTVVTVNGGNVRVRDAVITIRAVGTNITDIQVSITNKASWGWAGTLVVGDDLVIDCGAKRITNDGVGAYGDFYLQSGHADIDWLPLDPGSSTISVQRTEGANSTFKLDYYDAWA
jgi:hypothetical protein